MVWQVEESTWKVAIFPGLYQPTPQVENLINVLACSHIQYFKRKKKNKQRGLILPKLKISN